MGMKTKTAAQMAAAWQAAMQNPQTATNYKAGIQQVQANGVNPLALAATDEAQQLYIQNVQQSVTSGKRAASLNNPAALQAYFTNAVNVGAGRLSSGAQKATSKVQSFFQKWQPIYQQASDAANALPKGGMANALARVQASMQVLMQAAGHA